MGHINGQQYRSQVELLGSRVCSTMTLPGLCWLTRRGWELQRQGVVYCFTAQTHAVSLNALCPAGSGAFPVVCGCCLYAAVGCTHHWGFCHLVTLPESWHPWSPLSPCSSPADHLVCPCPFVICQVTMGFGPGGQSVSSAEAEELSSFPDACSPRPTRSYHDSGPHPGSCA